MNILKSKGYSPLESSDHQEDYVAISAGTSTPKHNRFISSPSKQILQVTNISARGKEGLITEFSVKCRTKESSEGSDNTSCANKTVELIQNVPNCLKP